MAAGAVDAEYNEDSITCSVCLDIFKHPKVLSCGHTFCREPCLLSLQKTRKHKKIHCPLCRSKIVLPKSGNVKDFPTNFSLQSILESRSKLKEPTNADDKAGSTRKRPLEPSVPPPCTHLQSAEFYCEQCEHFLCPECALLFHGDSQHSIIAKDTALDRARAQSEEMVQGTLTMLEKKVKRQGELLEEAKISVIDYDIRTSFLREEVSRLMESARRAIDEREQQYLQQIRARTDADKYVFGQITKRWETAKAADMRMLDQLRETLTQVRAGDLTSMDRVMSVGSIDVACTTMVQQTGMVTSAPPFTLVNTLPDRIPEMRQTSDELNIR